MGEIRERTAGKGKDRAGKVTLFSAWARATHPLCPTGGEQPRLGPCQPPHGSPAVPEGCVSSLAVSFFAASAHCPPFPCLLVLLTFRGGKADVHHHQSPEDTRNGPVSALLSPSGR